jgi:drug/metabolite transporter (DMT)-like permease
MILAGFGWGVYSLSGRLSVDALADSTRHFTRAVPLVLLVNILFMGSTHISWQGASLAALSGAVASGMGYAVWYAALAGLTATRAAVVQLSVPVLAAVGGILFLGEETSIRLFTAMTLILGGVAIAIGGRSRPALSALARS